MYVYALDCLHCCDTDRVQHGLHSLHRECPSTASPGGSPHTWQHRFSLAEIHPVFWTNGKVSSRQEHCNGLADKTKAMPTSTPDRRSSCTNRRKSTEASSAIPICPLCYIQQKSHHMPINDTDIHVKVQLYAPPTSRKVFPWRKAWRNKSTSCTRPSKLQLCAECFCSHGNVIRKQNVTKKLMAHLQYNAYAWKINVNTLQH